MTLLFVDGFDDGLQASKWSSWTMTTNATARTGGRSGSTTNAGDAHVQLSSTDKSATIITGFGFYPLANPNAGRRQWRFMADAGATTHISLARNSSGGLDLYRGATFSDTLIASSASGIVSLNAWTYIETKVVLHDTTGVVQVRLNGNTTPVINFSGDTKNAGTDTKIDRVSFGANTGDGNQHYFDDLYICNDAGSVNNDFLGDVSVQTVFPSGDGASSQWVGSDGNSVSNYLLVDESPDPNTTDYVESNTSGNIDTYAFTDLTGVTIKGVVHRSYAAKSDSGAQLMRQTVRISGTNYPGSDLSPSTTYGAFSRLMEASPATSTAWTLAEFNAAEFGVEAR